MSRVDCCLFFMIIIQVIANYHLIAGAYDASNQHTNLYIKSENKHNQLISLKQFCQAKYKDTIEPKVEPIMCPKLFLSTPHVPHRNCSRMFDSSIDISHSSLSSSYVDTKLYWQHLLNQFRTHLGKHVVFFLGDSMKAQMLTQLRCLEEFADIQFIHHHHIHGSVETGFPTSLPHSSLYNFSGRVDGDIVHRAFRQEWYDTIRGNNIIKYFVFNTGMWWNPNYFIYLKNNSILQNTDEMLDIYRDYFHRDGLLLTRLYDLIHNYNVTVLWRDTSPAGSCTIPDPHWSYHESISTMNMIAQSSLREIGVVIIPGIWDASLPYWKHHLERGSKTGYMDLVHYCVYRNQSLMNLWIRNTITTILEN